MRAYILLFFLLASTALHAQTGLGVSRNQVSGWLPASKLCAGAVELPGQSLASSGSSNCVRSFVHEILNAETYFGAIPNAADNTHQLEAIMAYEALNPGKCVFFPAGAYKTSSQLVWKDEKFGPGAADSIPLCLHGENGQSTYIMYTGAAPIDSTLLVGNPSSNQFSAVDFQDISFAANVHASYALHMIRIGPPSAISNVYGMGGNVSTFQAEFYNAQGVISNLTVDGQAFFPTGATQCVNGVTFTNGPLSGATFPSNQFSLVNVNIDNCTGIGLNMPNVVAVTVTNAQLSSNHQNLYEGCVVSGCNASGNHLDTFLDENGTISSEIHGPFNTINNWNTVNLRVYGNQNTFLDNQFSHLTVEPGASKNLFIGNWIDAASADLGTSTQGANNLNNFGTTWTTSFGVWGPVSLATGLTSTQCLHSVGGRMGGTGSECAVSPIVATLTTSGTTTDVVSMPGITATGHCSVDPTNSIAIAATQAGIIAKATNSVTVMHAATANLTYDIICMPY